VDKAGAAADADANPAAVVNDQDTGPLIMSPAASVALLIVAVYVVS
jgi:hypothetical protein